MLFQHVHVSVTHIKICALLLYQDEKLFVQEKLTWKNICWYINVSSSISCKKKWSAVSKVTWNFNFSASGAMGGWVGGSVGVSDLQKNYQADPEESGGWRRGRGVFMYNQQYWPIATYHLLPILFHVIFYMMLSQLFDRPKSGVTQYIRVQVHVLMNRQNAAARHIFFFSFVMRTAYWRNESSCVSRRCSANRKTNVRNKI